MACRGHVYHSYAELGWRWRDDVGELGDPIRVRPLFAEDLLLSFRWVPTEIFTGSDPSPVSGRNALEQAQRELIVRALRESNSLVGGALGAAGRLGLRRTTLMYKMRKLGIARPPQ